MIKKKLLLVGNAYFTEVNREKASSFSRLYEVCCVSHTPAGFERMGQKLSNADEIVGAEELPYQMHLLPTNGSTQSGTRYILKGFSSLVKKFKPDLILVEAEPWSLLVLQVYWIRRLHAKHAEIALFSWENLERVGIKGLVLSCFYRLAYHQADHIIAGNREAKSIFRKCGKNEDDIIVDAQLGFIREHLPSNREKNSKFWREAKGSSMEAIIIGYCGRFVEEKGVFDLIEAVKIVRDKCHQAPVELHFLGGGELEGKIKAMNLKWLKLYQPVKHTEVVSVLSSWDVLVLPSKRLDKDGELWEEQFGHVLLQGMGAGLLTLGSDSGAISEVLGDDLDVVFPAGDSKGLANIITRYLKNDNLMNEKIAFQQRRGRHYYSFNAIVDRYINLFERKK
jgi:glycosyltransferase involved in cell wall biosynthesis